MPSLTVAIVGKYQAEGIADTLLEIASIVTAAGHRVVVDRDTAHLCALKDYPALGHAEIGEQAAAAIVVGGDGTMLGIARQLAPYDVPLIGINQGRLGFMTDIPLDVMVDALSEMLAGRYEVEERTLLSGSVHRAAPTRDGDVFACARAQRRRRVARRRVRHGRADASTSTATSCTTSAPTG